MDVKLTVSKIELTNNKKGLYIVVSGRSPHYGTVSGEPNNVIGGMPVASVDAGEEIIKSLKTSDRQDLTGVAIMIRGVILENHSNPGRVAVSMRELKRLDGYELMAFRQIESFNSLMETVSRHDDAASIKEALVTYGASIGWTDKPAQSIMTDSDDKDIVEVVGNAEDPNPEQVTSTSDAAPTEPAAATEGNSPETSQDVEQAGQDDAVDAAAEGATAQESSEQATDNNNSVASEHDDAGAASTGEDDPGSSDSSGASKPAHRPVPAVRPAPITEEPPKPVESDGFSLDLGMG